MIIVDVETTGLDPKKNSIVSIGAVEFYKPTNQFYQECRISKGIEYTDKALEINGFSLKEIRDQNKQNLESITKKFLEWTSTCKKKTLAGENPKFDQSFLMESVKRYGLEWPLGRRTVDLHSISLGKHLELGFDLPSDDNGYSKLSADSTYNFVGIPKEPKPHIGINGAKWEAEAFFRLIHGQFLLTEFAKYQVPPYLTKRK